MNRSTIKNCVCITRPILVFTLVISLILPNFFVPDVAKAATFTDIRKHWAESYIEKAVSKGLVKGYQDGTFKPNKEVTRAEFAAMVNRLLKNNGVSYANFSDVSRAEWFYNDVSKAVSAAYVGGYKDGTFKPNAFTSRQEAAVMLSRFVPVAGVSGNISAFADAGSIESWAREAVAKINARGYLKGYPDGAFHPRDNVTRAMLAKILCEISDNENIITANTSVSTSGTSLANRIYSNNVDIQSSLRNGNATISNTVILGSLNVYGGGENSIRIDNSRIANANIRRSESPVSVLLSAHSVVANAKISEKAILETQNLSGGIFGKGFENVDVERDAHVAFRGEFPTVNLKGGNAKLTLERGSINNFDASYSASGSTMKVDSRGRINTATVSAKMAFLGDGVVDELNAKASGITYAKKPNRIYTSNGASQPTEDKSLDLEIKVTPKDNENNVGVNEDIILEFNDRVVNLKDKELSKSDVIDAIEIRKNRKSGTSIQYYVDISSNKRKITLDPKERLDKDTTYYVIIRDRQLKYEDGAKIKEQITTFYTGKDNKVGDATFYPKDGATGVSRSINPTIRFDEAIELKSGSSMTSSRLRDWIELREKNSSGRKVDFSVSINRNHTEITIEPSNKLNNDQKYYLEINGAGFRFSRNSGTVRGGSVTWTVGESTDIPKLTITPTNGATGVKTDAEISISFNKTVYANSSLSSLTKDFVSSNINLKLVENNSSISYTVSNIRSNPSRFTLTPSSSLLAGKQYEIIVESRFYDDEKNTNRRTTSRFTVQGITIDTSALDAAINTANRAKENVVAASDANSVEKGKFFVSQEQLTAFQNAINKAVTAKSSNDKNTIANATTELQNATNTFISNKRDGTRPNVSALQSIIQTAKNELTSTLKAQNAIKVANGKDWVEINDWDALNSKIDEAENYLKGILTDEGVQNASTELTNALNTFKAAKKPGKSDLDDAILKAKGKLVGVETATDASDISTTKKWATAEEIQALQSKIDAADLEKEKSTSTHDSVSLATGELEEAIDKFEPKSGTKQD